MRTHTCKYRVQTIKKTLLLGFRFDGAIDFIKDSKIDDYITEVNMFFSSSKYVKDNWNLQQALN